MSEEDLAVEELNARAVVGMVLSVGAGVVGLFLLPVLRNFGLSFNIAFWSLLTLEFLAVIGVTVSVLRLHEKRSFD
ncbi:hypothetical protein BRD14_06395 [Halobacteriales archaeon SW_5_68_122]|nr:MAG: hypothetical protein BRD14_06395 [Halobacteriales archaeon SW_5_68_122]